MGSGFEGGDGEGIFHSGREGDGGYGGTPVEEEVVCLGAVRFGCGEGLAFGVGVWTSADYAGFVYYLWLEKDGEGGK